MRLILRKLPVTAFTAVAIFDAVKYFFFLVFVKKIDVLRRCASETADLLQSKKDDTF